MNVGDHITDRQTYLDLPIGSRVKGSREWEKTHENRWRRTDGMRNRTSYDLSVNGGIRITRLPLVTRFSVGDGLHSIADFDDLPIGAEIGPSEAERFRKDSQTGYATTSGSYNPHENHFTMGGYNRVLSLPEWVTEEQPHGKETAAQFMWRFRQHVLSSAADNGINIEPVVRALAALKADPENLPLGKGVKVQNRIDLEALPDGTIVYTGDAADHANYGAFVRSGGRWVHALGAKRGLPAAVTVDRLGEGVTEPPEWLLKSYSEEDERAIISFKAKAYSVGKRAKTSNSWCGTYDRTMQGIGITREAIAEAAALAGGPVIGTEVSTDEAAVLPEGAILTWKSTTSERWAVFIRDNSSTNTSRTRRLFGHPDTTRNYASRMTVGYVPVEGLDLEFTPPATLAESLPYLPPGTIFTYDHNTSHFMVCRDHTVGNADRLRDSGQWNAQSFGTAPTWEIVGLPS